MSASSSPDPRRPSSRVRLAALVVVALAALLLLGAPAQAGRRDHRPPVFAGLKSATTCIPGPIGAGSTSSYHLAWDPAKDNVTPSAKIVYEIYQATKPGGEDFSTRHAFCSCRGRSGWPAHSYGPAPESQRSWSQTTSANTKPGCATARSGRPNRD